MSKLSEDLRPIYQFELDRGNEVVRVDKPAGTNCPYAVVFKNPLHKKGIEAELDLPASVEYWESRDPHYPKEAGYYSETTKHSVAGPIGN
jgi:hypothetical protein